MIAADTITPLVAAMTAIDEQVKADTSDRTPLIAAKIRGLMAGYDVRWASQTYRTVAVEQFVKADLWNPETGAKSRTFNIAGVVDVICEDGDKLILVDHKSTSDDIADPASPYWSQLTIEGQVSHYMLIEWLNGRKFDASIWDVIRKPSIRPSKISAAEVKSLSFSRQYCGRNMSDASVDEAHRSGRETLEMYEARLAQDCTSERPNWYFQRRSVPRLDMEVVEYAKDLWDNGQEIIQSRYHDRHTRNAKACMAYGSPCRYLGICSGHDTPDSDNWFPKAQVHNELPIIGSDGRDVLTNSRLSTFQTCRRKHFYQYEMGIERLEEEEREALYFGRLLHIALEHWWKEKGRVCQLQ